MTKTPQTQTMKPETAAKKLGILADAAPDEFRAAPVTREALEELQSNPPEWLAELRREGPHPRREIARRLGVSTSALGRAGLTEPLTTTEVRAIFDDMPEWLVAEREIQRQVREDERLRRAAPRPSAGGTPN